MELSGIPSSPPERQFTNNNIKINEYHNGKGVAAKFADGDIKGAVREISSSGNLAIHNDETLKALSLIINLLHRIRYSHYPRQYDNRSVSPAGYGQTGNKRVWIRIIRRSGWASTGTTA
ncbi:hypothetical protein GJ496_006454 [Pomphorhynchus laevis]|nr:hypothetical protein GJ496_006454 [Pomphorhynchus laevis]